MRFALSLLLLAAELAPARAQLPQNSTVSITYGSAENANYWPDMGNLSLQTEKAFFYARADTTSRRADFISQGQYVAILRQIGEWSEAETVSATGARRTGWLWQPDLMKQIWIPQRGKTPHFRFQLAYADTAADADGRRGALPTDLRVISRKTGRVQQLIPLNVEEPDRGAYNETLKVLDCNFDGFPDLMVYISSGAVPNSIYNFYLFRPKTGRFVLNAALSKLTQVDIDAKTKTITSAFRNGNGQHGQEKYRFVNGRLTCTASHFEYCVSSDGLCTITDGRLVHGKWVEKQWEIAESALYADKPPVKKKRARQALHRLSK